MLKFKSPSNRIRLEVIGTGRIGSDDTDWLRAIPRYLAERLDVLREERRKEARVAELEQAVGGR